MLDFQLITDLKPKGDQPKAIRQLVEGLKKGHRFQTLIGITGSGKSLTPQERVLIGVKQKGRITPILIPIGKLVEHVFSLTAPCQTVNGDEIVFAFQTPQRYFAFAFDPTTKKVGWRPITAFHRHPSPQTLFKVRTACGREVTVTGDHNLWVLRNGEMSLLTTSELREGDWIPLPLTLPDNSAPLVHVSVAHALCEGKKVYAQVPSRYVGKMNLHWSKRWRVQNCGEGVPLHLIPEALQAKVILKGKKHSIPAVVSLSGDWLNLLGIYIAEGHSTSRYVTLSVRNKSLQAKLKRCIAKIGFTFSLRQDGDIQISSMLLARLLTKWCGRKAKEKQLPPFWMSLSNKQLGQLLSAYFDGDGGVGSEGVYCSTVSRKLADDILWALMRFGIWGRIRAKEAKTTSGKLYRHWIVQITGHDNLVRFASSIGFNHLQKRKKLRALLNRYRYRLANTNVDVIPIAGEIFRKLREQLGLTQWEIASRAGISQSLVSMIEHSKRLPSRSAWSRLMKSLKEYLHDEHPTTLSIRHWQSLLNLRWAKIVAIKPIETQSPWVYDLSVEGCETFLAGFGGIFVHNTFTIANVIAQWNKPTLIICHNKTLAAQLCAELRQLFPHNSVEYFVSFYDYYQPEAYIPQTDTYIEKDCDINDEIDRLRHAATQAVSTRRDVIVVASVSCIYGLGSPELYQEMTLTLERGKSYDLRWVLRKLVDLYFARNDYELERGTFRLRGDVLEIRPAYEEMVYRVEFFGDEVDSITVIDPLTGEVMERKNAVVIYPASHYVCTRERLERALKSIEQELQEQLERFHREGKLLEAQRLKQRVHYDLELLRETGYCKGIENYSRHFDGRKPGEPPYTLIDYFPKDFLLIIDESHQTIPQLRAMYEGEMSRKRNLVEFGWRLPSAYDHRPLKFEEFLERINQCIFMSATPSEWELSISEQVVEQIVRPTGLLDPEVEVRPTKGQIEDLVGEIKKRVEKGQRVLVTTLTKRTAEDLTAFLTELGIKAHYLHHDIEAIERTEILRDLRLGNYDVLVGINLLREGLDLPEVSLVAILDADKEGFLRSYTSLIQIMGRAARHVEGKVIMYADTVTESMRKAIEETNRRRRIQEEFNRKHSVKPQSIQKPVYDAYLPVPSIMERRAAYQIGTGDAGRGTGEIPPLDEIPFVIKRLEKEMHEAAKRLEFERAAELRDRIRYLRGILYGEVPTDG